MSKIKEEVWNEFCPVIKVGKNKYEVYITDNIEAPINYNKLIYELDKAKSKDIFKLILNTGGGYLDSAFMISDALKKSKAKIVGELYGTVASAGTLIALSCDELIINDNVNFMVHNFSSSISGKGAEMKAYIDYYAGEFENVCNKIYKNFLTKEEIKSIIQDNDLWFNSKEIKKRWKNYKKGK